MAINLKRRRRLNTQTIQRKKTTQIQRRPAPKEPNRFWAFIKFLMIIGLIVLIGYTGYKYLLPVMQQKLPSLHISKDSGQTVTPVPEKPAPLPVEKPTETPEAVSTRQEQQNETFVKATQVEILNGCGQQGIAKVLAEKLRALKYDVVNTGNYLKRGKPYFKVKKTRMIDQLNTKKSRKKCLKLAKEMGLSSKQVQSFSNPNPIADITIILGADYNKLPIFKGKK